MAIPAVIPEHTAQWQEGMSLRDWFAGMAMQGIKSNPELCRICSNIEGMTQQQAIARMSYVDADAMLLERDKAKS